MKTLTRNSDNVSLYLWSDDTTVTLQSDKTLVGDVNNPSHIILDCNSSNSTLHTNVTKQYWWGHKYKYDGTSWSNNTNFKGSKSLNVSMTSDQDYIEFSVLGTKSFTVSGKVQIEDEIISYTGVNDSETKLTGCTRGVDGSTATAHDIEDGAIIVNQV